MLLSLSVSVADFYLQEETHIDTPSVILSVFKVVLRQFSFHQCYKLATYRLEGCYVRLFREIIARDCYVR